MKIKIINLKIFHIFSINEFFCEVYYESWGTFIVITISTFKFLENKFIFITIKKLYIVYVHIKY